ncbi:MAG: hypothetical protein ACYTFA_12715 [Planctomycetota bacterium]
MGRTRIVGFTWITCSGWRECPILRGEQDCGCGGNRLHERKLLCRDEPRSEGWGTEVPIE